MKLVEVIRAADTAPWVIEAMVALGKRQTRVPVIVGDTPGFLVNLGGTAIGTEGLRIYQEGRATPSQIDAVMRDAGGFRMGPFELMDLTGIDVNFPARKIIYEGFFHDRRMTPSPYHEGLFHAGKLGRKTGSGWYDYKDGAKVDPGADVVTSAKVAEYLVADADADEKVLDLLRAGGAEVSAQDDGEAPIIVTPLGDDCTTVCVAGGLDPSARWRSTTAPSASATIMICLAAMLASRRVAATLAAAGEGDGDGTARASCRSACDDRQSRLQMARSASPAADVDTAMTWALTTRRPAGDG